MFHDKTRTESGHMYRADFTAVPVNFPLRDALSPALMAHLSSPSDISGYFVVAYMYT